MKPFEKWLTQEVELTFGIKQKDELPVLNNWLAADETIEEDEMKLIQKYRINLSKKGDFWNEDELKFKFIAPYLSLFNYDKEDVYTSFSQRILSSKDKDVNGKDVILRGRVEWFVARGKQIPSKPIFFIHEYKPTLKSTPSDPKGQLLIAMHTAQVENADEKPLYGIYVIGNYWYFVVLGKKEYAVSRSYDMTQQAQIEQVTKILKRTKVYIEEALG